MSTASKEEKVLSKNVLNIKVAKDEVSSWLDHKKISDSDRSDNEDSIEKLIRGFEDGVFSMNPDSFEIEMKLRFSKGSQNQITGFKFAPRIQLSDVHPYLKKVKPGDLQGMIVAYIAALTGQNTNVIKTLDTVDYSYASSIAVFFL